MEWSGRVPAPPAIEAGQGRQRKGARHVQTLGNAVAVIGIDIGKNSFHVVELDRRGVIVLRCSEGSHQSVEMSLGCVKTCTREKAAELFSLLSSLDGGGQCFCFGIWTVFLFANSILEFSHSLGHQRHFECALAIPLCLRWLPNRCIATSDVQGQQETMDKRKSLPLTRNDVNDPEEIGPPIIALQDACRTRGRSRGASLLSRTMRRRVNGRCS